MLSEERRATKDAAQLCAAQLPKLKHRAGASGSKQERNVEQREPDSLL